MSTVSGEISVMFEVSRISDDVCVVVLRSHMPFTEEHIYREKKGKVYVGVKGSKQAGIIVAGLVRYAIAALKEKERDGPQTSG